MRRVFAWTMLPLLFIFIFSVLWFMEWKGEILKEEFWKDDYCEKRFIEYTGQKPLESGTNIYGDCVFKLSELDEEYTVMDDVKGWKRPRFFEMGDDKDG